MTGHAAPLLLLTAQDHFSYLIEYLDACRWAEYFQHSIRGCIFFITRELWNSRNARVQASPIWNSICIVAFGSLGIGRNLSKHLVPRASSPLELSPALLQPPL